MTLEGFTKEDAGGRTRTDMEQAPRDFESRASTNFTTPALMKHTPSPKLNAHTRTYYEERANVVKEKK